MVWSIHGRQHTAPRMHPGAPDAGLQAIGPRGCVSGRSRITHAPWPSQAWKRGAIGKPFRGPPMANHSMLWSPESNGYPTLFILNELQRHRPTRHDTECSVSTPVTDTATDTPPDRGRLRRRAPTDLRQLLADGSAYGEIASRLTRDLQTRSSKVRCPLRVVHHCLVWFADHSRHIRLR